MVAPAMAVGVQSPAKSSEFDALRTEKVAEAHVIRRASDVAPGGTESCRSRSPVPVYTPSATRTSMPSDCRKTETPPGMTEYENAAILSSIACTSIA